MLIASIVIIALFIIFIVTTYIITIKNYTFEIEGQKLKVHNQGSKLQILLNDKVVLKANMPQLIHGESYDVEINKKVFTIKCQSNSFGNKMRVEVLQGEKLIADNGIILATKNKKEPKE